MIVPVKYLVLKEAAALCLWVNRDGWYVRNCLEIWHMFALDGTLEIGHRVVPLPFLRRLATNVTVEQLLLDRILLLEWHVSDLCVTDRAETTL